MTSPVTVRVWLTPTSSPVRDRTDLLSAVERERRTRYAMPDDRDRFTVGTVVLRAAAGACLGIAPEFVDVDRRCECGRPHGRPRLPGSGLHASVSHSDDLVAVALCDAAPVGIDVERMTARDVSGLARVALGAGEYAATAAQFYTYWCRKEAVLKATGAGLRVAPSAVLVSPPAERADARVLGYDGTTLACRLAELPDRPADYAGAVAVLGDATIEVVVAPLPAMRTKAA